MAAGCSRDWGTRVVAGQGSVDDDQDVWAQVPFWLLCASVVGVVLGTNWMIQVPCARCSDINKCTRALPGTAGCRPPLPSACA